MNRPADDALGRMDTQAMNAPMMTAATGDALRREVVIANPQGLHLRPATAFAKRAREFACTVFVIRDSQRANGKSQMELLMLAAQPGSRLTVEVDGADADKALDPLAELLADQGEIDSE